MESSCTWSLRWLLPPMIRFVRLGCFKVLVVQDAMVDLLQKTGQSFKLVIDLI
jgi:hypothetical protein